MNVNPRPIPSLLTDKPSRWEVIYRSVNGLRRDPANPRRRSTGQIRQTANSKFDPVDLDTVVRRCQALTDGSAGHATNARNFGDDLARKTEAASAA
jgi:hypothetical protein